MKLTEAKDFNKSKLSSAQYRFISELIWGSVPVDRVWSEETSIFKENSWRILKNIQCLINHFLKNKFG